MSAKQKRESRERRHLRVRSKVAGTAECPRLNVYRSNRHLFAQVIDDAKGHTLVSASTVEEEMRKALADKTKTEQAVEIGKLIAKRAKEAGVNKVVFDRGGFQYHGRVKALADAAREGGLEF